MAQDHPKDRRMAGAGEGAGQSDRRSESGEKGSNCAEPRVASATGNGRYAAVPPPPPPGDGNNASDARAARRAAREQAGQQQGGYWN